MTVLAPMRHARRHALNVAASLAWLLPLAASAPAPVRAAEPHFAFAVVSGAIRSPTDEPAAQRLLQAAGFDGRLAFVVYDGNLKGVDERCTDTLFERRLQLLQASTVPLVVLPGQHDWADCATAAGGRYDAAERLDYLRQTMFSDTVSLGAPTLALTRESEVARFHAFRENVRWEVGDTVFVGLDVVGGNNHYSDAGGRNGEFDDRAIASSFWLEHAAEYARRRSAKALVVLVEADPDFTRYEEHGDRFAWLRFARHRTRDGYLEFKRSLVKAAQTFRGPVIVIHHDAHASTAGFTIDQPLFNDKGVRVNNLTRIAIAPNAPSTQWVEFAVSFARPAPFRVSVHTAPKTPLALPAPPSMLKAPPAPASEASGPAIEPLPGIQNVAPAPAQQNVPQGMPAWAPQPSFAPMPSLEPPLLPSGAPVGPASGASGASGPGGKPGPTAAPSSSAPSATPPQVSPGTALPQAAPNSVQGGGS